MATDDGNGGSRANKIAAWSLVGTVVGIVAGAVFAVVQIGQSADWFCGTPLGKRCEVIADPTGATTPPPTIPNDDEPTPPTTDPATRTPPIRAPTRTPPNPTPESTGDTPVDKPVARVVWRGKVLIHKAAGIELDTAPPSQATGPAGTIESADVLLDNSRYGTTYRLTAMSGARFADVTGDGIPNAYSCLESLQTVPVGDAPAEVGTTLCVGTGDGNVTMVRVTGDADDGVYLAVTQWR